MLPGQPCDSELSNYFKRYIASVPDDLFKYLEDQIQILNDLLSGLTDEQWAFSYAEDKWNLKEVLIHINDTERIFAYRALCMARMDTTALPGYDQDPYIDSALLDHIDPDLLLNEFIHMRRSNLYLFRTFNLGQWTNIGTVSGNPMSARAAAYIIAGHFDHHIKIIRDRYLQ